MSRFLPSTSEMEWSLWRRLLCFLLTFSSPGSKALVHPQTPDPKVVLCYFLLIKTMSGFYSPLPASGHALAPEPTATGNQLSWPGSGSALPRTPLLSSRCIWGWRWRVGVNPICISPRIFHMFPDHAGFQARRVQVCSLCCPQCLCDKPFWWYLVDLVLQASDKVLKQILANQNFKGLSTPEQLKPHLSRKLDIASISCF